MNSNGTANKGGKGPATIKKDDIRPVPEEKRRSFFGGFLKSLGADPNNVKEFETRRTRTPPEPDATPSSPPRTLVGDFREQVHPSGEKPPETETNPEPPAETKTRKISDGYSAEFSLGNLPNLSQDPGIPTGPAQDGRYAEFSVTGSGDGFDITDEDIERVLGFRPSESPDGSSEVSTTISEAVVNAAARMGRGKNPPVKLRSDRATLPPPPASAVSIEPPIREDTEARRTGILPGSPPETGLTIEQHIANKGEVTDRTKARFNAMTSAEHEAEIPLGAQLREESIVLKNIEIFKEEVPVRFHPYIDDAMKSLQDLFGGFESDVERMVLERRWKYEREERVIQGVGLPLGVMLSIFSDMYQDEAIRRYSHRKEYLTDVDRRFNDPGEVEKGFIFAIIDSNNAPAENKEMCLFDAWCKCAAFMFLGNRRPRTLFQALGRSASKPYGKLGGMEGLGVYEALELPDLKKIKLEATKKFDKEYKAWEEKKAKAEMNGREFTDKEPRLLVGSLSASHIGPAFRLSMEVHLTHLIQWIQDAVRLWPNDERVVGRFNKFVYDELKEFQECLSDEEVGFNADKFFQILNRERHDNIRQDPSLVSMFEKAAAGPGKLVYGHADDVFDALEAIVQYMYLLKTNEKAKDLFINHFLASYPLKTNGSTFYKIFGMCLFTCTEDMNRHSHTVKAFRMDPDPTVHYHIEEAIHRLHPRETLVGGIEDGFGDDELDRAIEGFGDGGTDEI